MKKQKYQTYLLVGASACIFATASALAESFNIPDGDLKSALDSYTRQAGSNT